MSPKLIVFALLCVSLTSRVCVGYELSTHGLLTYKAFSQSVLQPGSPLRRDLGIEVYLADPVAFDRPFGNTYFDFFGTDARLRQADALAADGKPFDKTKMVTIFRVDSTVEFSPERNNLRLPGWLMRGAIREDDDSSKTEPNPKDDPFAPFDPLNLVHRVSNHFYDPVSTKGLTVAAITPGLPAPAWALGVAPSNIFGTSPEEDTGRSNHFTIYDAHEALYRAMTGRSRLQVQVANNEIERKRYWATFFRALGDVVHLVQDMAQPQHTRNEPHAGVGSYDSQSMLLGHKSVYEAYIEARAIGGSALQYAVTTDNKFSLNIIPGRPLPMDGYPIPHFNRYSDYFSTAPQDGVAQGSGMADYSNRGFLTVAKNLGNTDYTMPSPNPASYRTANMPLVGWNGVPFEGTEKITLFLGTVADSVDASRSAADVPLSSQSVWDEFLQHRGKYGVTLNWFNYDAAANLLLPRAVAYSAGLIDYFFRGKLEISLPDEGVYGVIDQSIESQPYANGFRRIKLKLRNVTPPVVPTAGPQKDQSIAQDMSGTVLAVVKYHENTCYQADLSGEFGSREIRSSYGDAEFSDSTATPAGCRRTEEKIAVSDAQPPIALTAGTANSTSLTFTFANPIPVNATDVYLQVVFRGVQGSEQDAVVVGTKDISEPTHFTLVNVTDYLVCYNDNWYYKNADGSLPASIPNQYSSALQAQPYSATRFAFGKNAGTIGGGVLSNPLVVVSDLAPGQFARFAILTEPEVVFNDEIAGYYSPEPPPYKLHFPAGNQLTVQGTDLPNDPYALREDWGPIDSFRNTRYFALSFGYPTAGTGDCHVRPPPASPALPWKPLPKEPGYALVPTIKPVTINFN